MTLYAIGDVHGHPDKLGRALRLIEDDGGKDAEIIFVGDYIDRGPDSRAVIQHLIEGLDAGRNWTCLKGNHDRMMEWFLEDTPRHDPHLLVGYHWFHERIGGLTTMESYGVEVGPRERLWTVHNHARKAVPESHRDFLRNLKVAHYVDHYLFVHAGIRPGVPLDHQTERDLVWIREGFLDNDETHPCFVVHGHTPIQTPTLYHNRLNTDGGAAFGRPLVPIGLEDGKVFALMDEGRVELRPDDSHA